MPTFTRRRRFAAVAALSSLALAAVVAVPALVSTEPRAHAAAAAAEGGTFKIDAVHSSAGFRITHLGVAPFYGRFDDPQGTFTLSGSDLQLEITIDVNKVNTGNKQRDDHLRGPDFFNVAQFPTATFKSKSAKVEGDTFTVTGDLTLKGRTKEVTATLKKIGEADRGQRFGYRAGFDAELTINRMDFGVDAMPDALGQEVTLRFGLEGVRG